MRIRSIKPEFYRSSDIGDLAVEDRFLFIGLWSYVDDNGVGRDELADIIGDLFSRDMLASPRETVARVQGGLSRLQTAGLIARYEANGKRFLHVTTWTKHQRVDKPAAARYPEPDPHDSGLFAPDEDEDRVDSRESREGVAPGTGEQGNRGTGEQSSPPDGGEDPRPRKRATRIPDPFIVTADMRQWAAIEAPAVDVDRSTRTFVDHWRAASGRNATKQNWIAAWRNWLRRDADYAPRGPRPTAPASTKDDRAAATLRLGAEIATQQAQVTDLHLVDLKALPA